MPEVAAFVPFHGASHSLYVLQGSALDGVSEGRPVMGRAGLLWDERTAGRPAGEFRPPSS